MTTAHPVRDETGEDEEEPAAWVVLARIVLPADRADPIAMGPRSGMSLG
jgi:hypothetical protein